MTRCAVTPRSLFGITLLALLGACSESPSVNAPGAISLDVVPNTIFLVHAGDNQRGTPGSVLGVKPSVLVTGPWGHPIEELEVFFDVLSGGGSVAERITLTNEEGIASVEWRLGPTPGTQTIAAYVERFGVRSNPLIFHATATGQIPPPEPPTTEKPTEKPPEAPTNQKPVASFTVTREGTTCTFDGTGSTDDAGIVSYTWRSSDAGRPVKQGSVITRICGETNSWTEWLVVQDAGGLVDSTSRQVVPSSSPPPAPPANQKPVASFTVTRAGEVCTFDGTASSDDAGIVSFTWRSSDVLRPVQSGSIVTRDCGYFASWTEWLIVRDEGGLVDSTSRTVLPGSPPPPPPQPEPTTNQKPVASFTVTRVGEVCTFDGTASTDDAGIINHTWRSSAGGRPEKYGSVVARECGQSESWTEWLIVQDAEGLVDSTSRIVAAVSSPPPPPPAPTNQKPVASFTVTRAGIVCTFNGTGSTDDAGIVSYTWRSSDPGKPVKNGSLITRECDGNQQWVEWLIVRDAAGLVDSTSRNVAFAPVPPSGPEQPPASPGRTVTVSTGVTYQTMTGWQAVAEIGSEVAGYAQWRDAVIQRAADDNINRLRVEAPSGIENTRDAFTQLRAGQITMAEYRCLRYSTVNDNASSASLDRSKFSFGILDSTMTSLVVPLKQRLQERGEVLGITITYVSFWNGCGGGQYAHSDPEEYAEFAVAIMQYLQERYGVVPDTWELINEPDDGSVWTVNHMAASLIAIDRRLKQAGFNVSLVAPSDAFATRALTKSQSLLSTGAGGLISQLGWHRYDGPGSSTVQMLGNLAASRGISTAMTEFIGADYNNLITDLTAGRASTWSQYALAFPTGDQGAQYYIPQGSNITTASRTKYLRHYFRHVRRGAVRIGASSGLSAIVPVAFRNPNGLVTVVIKYDSPGTISVSGLPAGRYSVGFESDAVSDGLLPDVIVGANGIATVNVQSRGVVVLYGR